jgi:hypothetical protein
MSLAVERFIGHTSPDIAIALSLEERDGLALAGILAPVSFPQLPSSHRIIYSD